MQKRCTTTELTFEGHPNRLPTNGDKYWARPFAISESIRRAQEFNHKGTRANVMLGLELLWAKLNVSHGGWYPYLLRIGIDPSGATRRMKLARQYIELQEIKAERVRVEEHHILKAIEAVNINPAQLHGLEKVDIWSTRDIWPNSDKGTGSGVGSTILGVSLAKVLRTVDHTINQYSLAWTPEQLAEAKDTLEMWVSRLQRHIHYLNSLGGKENDNKGAS